METTGAEDFELKDWVFFIVFVEFGNGEEWLGVCVWRYTLGGRGGFIEYIRYWVYGRRILFTFTSCVDIAMIVIG